MLPNSNTVRIGRAPGTPEQLAPTADDFIRKNGGLTPAGSHDGMGSLSSFYQLQSGPTPNEVLQNQMQRDQHGSMVAQYNRGLAHDTALDGFKNGDTTSTVGLHSWEVLPPETKTATSSYATGQGPSFAPTAPPIAAVPNPSPTFRPVPGLPDVTTDGNGLTQLTPNAYTGNRPAFSVGSPLARGGPLPPTPQALSLATAPASAPAPTSAAPASTSIAQPITGPKPQPTSTYFADSPQFARFAAEAQRNAPEALSFPGGGSYSGPMGDDREMRRLSMGTPQEREFGYHMGQQKALAEERMSDRRAFNDDRTLNTKNQFDLAQQKAADQNKRAVDAQGIQNKRLDVQQEALKQKEDAAKIKEATAHHGQAGRMDAMRSLGMIDDATARFLAPQPPEMQKAHLDVIEKMKLKEKPTADHPAVGVQTLPTGEKVFHHGNGTASLIVDPKPAPTPHFSAEKSHTIAEKLRDTMFDKQTGKASAYYNSLDPAGQKELWDEYNYHRDNSRPYLKKGQQAAPGPAASDLAKSQGFTTTQTGSQQWMANQGKITPNKTEGYAELPPDKQDQLWDTYKDHKDNANGEYGKWRSALPPDHPKFLNPPAGAAGHIYGTPEGQPVVQAQTAPAAPAMLQPPGPSNAPTPAAPATSSWQHLYQPK